MEMLIQLRAFLALAMLLSSAVHAGPLTDKICELLFLKRPAKVAAVAAPLPTQEKPESDLWIDNIYENPTWVMEQARQTFQELGSLPTEQRNQKSILYFKKQMPLLISLVRNIRAPANAKYWMVDRNGEPLNNGVNTVEQAKEWLVNEGKKHYFENSITLEWFPQFVMEVIGLRWFVHQMTVAKWEMPEPQELKVWYQKLMSQKAFGVLNETPFWYQYHMLRNKMILEDERAQGFLHWPTIATLRLIHFDDWHLGIKPLGYTKTISAWTDGVETDVFDLFDHDLAFHMLPEEFLPYRQKFAAFKKIYDQKVAQETTDQQVLLRIQWFDVTHETTALYYLFIKFMQSRDDFHIMDCVEEMSEQFLSWFRDNAVGVTSPGYARFSGEWTESFKKLSPEQRRAETGKAFQTFRRHLIHSFEEYKKSL